MFVVFILYCGTLKPFKVIRLGTRNEIDTPGKMGINICNSVYVTVECGVRLGDRHRFLDGYRALLL